MSLGSLVKLGFVLWLVAETLVFIVVSRLLGVPEALLLEFLTSLFGWTRLKTAGASAILKLRAGLGGRRVVGPDAFNVLDDTLAGIGALALLLPGFLSDLVGLGLLVPWARIRIARLLKSRRFADILRSEAPAERRGPATIDLEPGDWEHTTSSRPPASRY